MTKILKIISDLIFYLGLAIAGLVLVNRFTGWPGMQLLAVTSGSMEPAIKTGSVVLVRPEKDYLAGDIITFQSGSKSTTTHRAIFKLWPEGVDGVPQFMTAGDANKTLDVTTIGPEKIIGKVVLSVPYVGYITGRAKTPVGFILLVIVPGTIVIYEELKSLWREAKSAWVKTVKTSLTKPASRAMVMLPIIAAVCVITTLTGAYFSDRAISSENILAVAIPTPTPVP